MPHTDPKPNVPLKPTMMDVAALAGVSQATVSLVLNGNSGARFAESTRKKVHDAAETLGYRLTNRQQGVGAGDFKVISFIADEVATDPWMALAFEGAREKALEHNIYVSLTVAGSFRSAQDEVFSLHPASTLMGYIYGTILTRQVVPPEPLFEAHSVLLNCYDKDRRLPSIVPGDLAGGRAATERLITAGHRRIGLINGQDGIDTTRDRLKGYKQALASNDINFDPELARPGNWEPSSGYEETINLMSLPSPPDAIFCANDMMAVGCYEALKEMGKSIPDDVAVVGFDNREIAAFMHPALTTFVLPHHQMGGMAVEQLIDSAGGLKSRHNQMKVECAMIERNSV